ncbi:HAMP domain-containing sensor histidine kinase [Sphingomonas sp. HF-S3]|uniref:histidine kinase n=1 Tax=Sphingomonas rustica TaxID=3103142 RepID=A0ABV0BES3_9SPHN
MRGASLRVQVALFTVAGILICLAVSFGIALAFPDAEPQRVSLAEAIHAATARDVPPGWRRRIADAPPFETPRDGPDIVIRAGLAATLGLPNDRVRVRSFRQVRPGGAGALRQGASDGAALSAGAEAMLARMALAPGARFAPFALAIREGDARWVVLTPDRPLLTPERARMLIAFALAAAILIPLALWGAARLTAPFRRLAQAAADDGRLDSAAWVGGPVEAARAAEAIDAMRARMIDHLRSRTTMMAAIAHDLRTPLTALRLRVEGLAGIAREEAVSDIARMERMIAQLLAYVRGESVAAIDEPVDLVDVVQDCARRQRIAGATVTLAAEGEHLVFGDRDLLDRAVSNLIDNAVIHGGRADIMVSETGGQVVCTIDDDGPGMAEDRIEAAFAPFHRLDPSRNRDTGGVGLGLAIARAIVERAGGTITLTNRPRGGLRAEVRLPPLRAAPP